MGPGTLAQVINFFLEIQLFREPTEIVADGQSQGALALSGEHSKATWIFLFGKKLFL